MYVLTLAQTEHLFKIISLVLSILISIFIILSKVVDWYKKAKADKKITEKELEDLRNTLNSGIEKIKEEADEIVEIVNTEEKIKDEEDKEE